MALIVSVITGAAMALAQRPVIQPQGIVNAASFGKPLHIASGGIVSIFGQNLATDTRQAESTPLPLEMAGTSVTIDGISAPLFYVSPGQINVQVPSRSVTEGGITRPVGMNGPAPVVVKTPAGLSTPVVANAYFDSIGVFTQGQAGCGAGAILNLGSDGSTASLNSPGRSASPGEYVAMYGTGLGPVTFPPADGAPAGTDPFSRTWADRNPLLGYEGFRQVGPPTSNYSGRAPRLVGVDQVNFRIPENTPEGCRVPLYVAGNRTVSQPVTISIRRGGGQCQDAAAASLGRMRWQRIESYGPEPGPQSVEETFTAALLEGPGNLLAPAGHFPDGLCTCGLTAREPGPRCRDAEPKQLDAGILTLQPTAGQTLSVNFSPDARSGYQTMLPAGSVGAGEYRVTAAGGPDAGPFQATVTVPPPIQLTTLLAPGFVVHNGRPFRLIWKNGSADSVVFMRISQHGGFGSSECVCNAPATAGELTLPVRILGDQVIFPLGPSNDAEITVTVEPALAQTPTFSAPGLTLGGTHEWRYEFRFRGVNIGVTQ